MTKVSIPAYKLRGESAILECIYELNRPTGHNYNNHDTDNDNDDEFTSYSSSTGNSRYNRVGSSGGITNNRHDGGYTNYGSNNKNLYRRIRRSYNQPQQQSPQHGRNYHQSYYQQPYQYQQHRQQQQTQSSQNQQPPLQLQSQTQPSSITSYGFQHDHHLQQQLHQQQQHQQHYSYENSNEKYDENDSGAGGEDEHHSNDGESLYAVKWYKDNEEFYRFVPKANPQKQSYRVDGVRVIVSRIGFTIYILYDLKDGILEDIIFCRLFEEMTIMEKIYNMRDFLFSCLK